MTFSKPLLGTNKTKLSWVEYIWFSCIQQGWYNCWYSFKNWGDLIGNNYTGYGILAEDDDLEWCIDYFWESLQDEIYPKHFLEELLQMVDDIDTGKQKTYSLDEVMADLKRDTIDPSVLEDWMGEPLSEEKLKELVEDGYVVAEEE